MGPETTYSGRLQGIGGGITDEDVLGARVDLLHSLEREMQEEVGGGGDLIIPRWIKTGGPWDFVAVICEVRVSENHGDFQHRYQDFVHALLGLGDMPEFSELVVLQAERQQVENFLARDSRPRVDYLGAALRGLVV
jgi:hypothetical protein